MWDFMPDFDPFDVMGGDDSGSDHRNINIKVINDRIFAEDGDNQYIIINRNNGKVKTFLHGDTEWQKSGRVKNDKAAWKLIGHFFQIWESDDERYRTAGK